MGFEERQALSEAKLGASMVLEEGKRTLYEAEERSVEEQKVYIGQLAGQVRAAAPAPRSAVCAVRLGVAHRGPRTLAAAPARAPPLARA